MLPKNKTITARLKLYENSPASVLGIFPPHIELPSLNKNASENIEAMIGIGNLYFKNLKQIYTQRGRRKIPKTVPILKAICIGMI